MEDIDCKFINKILKKYETLNDDEKIDNPFSGNNDTDINKKNLLRLFIGMIPSNLPKDLFLPGLDGLLLDRMSLDKELVKNSSHQLKVIENKLYKSFSFFVKSYNCGELKSIKRRTAKFKKRFKRLPKLMSLFVNSDDTPNYIFKSGIEPIKYEGIKGSNQLMLMGVDNPILYLIFIYNSFLVFKPLFQRLYHFEKDDSDLDGDNFKYIDKLVSNSESPILLNDKLINMEYYYPNSKYYHFNSHNKISVEDNAIHKFKLEKERPYYMKLNLQSFYPNIYTHNLDRASKHSLIRLVNSTNSDADKDVVEDYFTFLDKYNMKNNEERTKGLIVGPISSRISSELLSLDIFFQAQFGYKFPKNESTRLIDKELSGLFSHVKYARFVDNIIVFANDFDKLRKFRFRLGLFLQQYELKFRSRKSKIIRGLYSPKMANFSSIKRNLNTIIMPDNSKDKDQISISYFIHLRNYIKHLLDIKDISTLKAVFVELRNHGYNIVFDNKELMNLFISLLLKVAIICPMVSFNVYELIEQIIIRTNKDKVFDGQIEKELKNILNVVNDQYDNTVLQIWTYYLLNLLYDKYDDIKEKLVLFDKTPKSIKALPLITMCFISTHNSTELNDAIWDNIYNEYMKDEKSIMSSNKNNNQQSPNIYKTIMFSKWAFPIYKLHSICDMTDNPNAESSISRIFLGKDKSKNKYHVFRLFDLILASIKDTLDYN